MIIYHARCQDGFGAAWAYWQVLGDKALYVPALYGQELPSVRGQHVVMVDVSFPEDVIDRLVREAASFRLLDHHVSAFEELGHLPCAHFDLQRSGVGLAWQDLHGDRPLSKLMACIQDRDLGQHKIPGAPEILHVLDTLPHDFEAWQTLSERVDAQEEVVIREGTHMRAKFEALAHRLLVNASPLTQGGRHGLAVNAPMEFASMVGHILAQHADFGFTWYLDGQGRVHASWRSRKMNVIPLAQEYGGGGHENAAGARMDLALLATLLAHQGPEREGDVGGCEHEGRPGHTH